MKRKWLTMVALGVVVLTSASCGKELSETATETMIESAMRADGQEADVSIDSENVTIKTADGDMSFGEGTQLPDGWPGDVPVYKGLKLLSAMKSNESFMIQGSTEASFSEVSAYYREEVEKGGWTEETALTQPQISMLTYTKEGRTLSVVIGTEESGTSISLTVTSE